MKLNYKRTILIGLAFLSISAFWQMYDNVVPLILKNSFGLGETVTGAIMAADNVLLCSCFRFSEVFLTRWTLRSENVCRLYWAEPPWQ